MVFLGDVYCTDLDGVELSTVICDCRLLLENAPKRPLKLTSFIDSYGDDTRGPERESCTTTSDHDCSVSCERSFSKLKLILTYQRASVAINCWDFKAR